MNSGTIAQDQRSDWSSRIRQLEDEARQAFLAQDAARLRMLWSADLRVNSPLNRVLDREQVLDLLQRGIIHHAAYEIHIESIVRHGDVVIVMGHDVVANTPGSPPVHRRFTNLWRGDGESWLMIARHANPVAAT
jgi:ketosteroid isomerase-like protein